MSLLFALISQTKLVPPGDLYRLTHALEHGAGHCAHAWGLLPPAIVVCDDLAKLPATAHPIVFVDDFSDPSALGIHYWDPLRGIAARVYVGNTSGLNSGRDSVSEVASHEIAEALVDPRAAMWVDHPSSTIPGVQVSLEVCDPVQDTYKIRATGTDWMVANFVTPEWFDARFMDHEAMATLLAHGGGFDHSRTLQYPGEIGLEGYAVLRRPAANGYAMYLETYHRAGSPDAVTLSAAKQHQWARTQRRLTSKGNDA